MQSEKDALIEKYAVAAFKHRGDQLPLYVWRQHFVEFAEKLAALSTGAEPVAWMHPKGAIWRADNCPTDENFGPEDGWIALYAAPPAPPAPAVAVKALRLDTNKPEFDEFDKGWEACLDAISSLFSHPSYDKRIRSALSAQVQDVAEESDIQLAIIHSVIEKAANAADAAVYEAMGSNSFDPTIPDNVAEFVGDAVRKSFEASTRTPSSSHVNGGAYRIISVDEWRSLGGDENKLCDWHEGIGYVIYDDIAKEQYRAKLAAAPAAKQEGDHD